MDHAAFAARFPRLFHVTEAGAWASIGRHGLLSTSALLDLFEVTEPLRSQIELAPRRDDVVLEHPRAGRAVIRDNRPLRRHILERCLQDATIADWCRLLNARVFLWATEKRLRTHLAARGHRGAAREVLTIDTARLLERHAQALTVCAFNSGSALYPNAPRRGAGSFVRIADAGDAVAEVCVDRALPDVAALAVSVVSA